MPVRIEYTYVCERCGAEGRTDSPHGMHGWLQLGISGSSDASPYFCSWRCLLIVAAENLGSEPVAPHSH